MEDSTKEQEQGGMGVKNLKLQNNCLLMKWLWSCNEEGQALWKEVIQQKYWQNKQWCNDEVTDNLRVGSLENY